jgi:hypothetical protein
LGKGEVRRGRVRVSLPLPLCLLPGRRSPHFRRASWTRRPWAPRAGRGTRSSLSLCLGRRRPSPARCLAASRDGCRHGRRRRVARRHPFQPPLRSAPWDRPARAHAETVEQLARIPVANPQQRAQTGFCCLAARRSFPLQACGRQRCRAQLAHLPMPLKDFRERRFERYPQFFEERLGRLFFEPAQQTGPAGGELSEGLSWHRGNLRRGGPKK